jgi:putative alpha-1,2-mannosidase
VAFALNILSITIRCLNIDLVLIFRSYDDIFTLWDLFRCSTALVQVLQPMAYEEQIRSLVDIWRHEGWLPDARS